MPPGNFFLFKREKNAARKHLIPIAKHRHSTATHLQLFYPQEKNQLSIKDSQEGYLPLLASLLSVEYRKARSSATS